MTHRSNFVIILSNLGNFVMIGNYLINNHTCQTSMALVYATGGKAELIEAVWVDMVSKVVTPSATRAGTAWASSQKLWMNKYILTKLSGLFFEFLPSPSIRLRFSEKATKFDKISRLALPFTQ